MEETGLSAAGELVLIDVVDSIARAADGRIMHHYTLIDFAAFAAPGTARPGGDSADVAWVRLRDLACREIWPPTLAVIGKAAGRLGVQDEQ